MKILLFVAQFPDNNCQKCLTCKLSGKFVLFRVQSDKSFLLEIGVVEQNN